MVKKPAKKIDQVDSKIKDVGVVLHVQEEVYQSTLTFRRRVAGYQEWFPWSLKPKILFVSLTHPTSKFYPKLNQIKDKIPILGLDIVEHQV